MKTAGDINVKEIVFNHQGLMNANDGLYATYHCIKLLLLDNLFPIYIFHIGSLVLGWSAISFCYVKSFKSGSDKDIAFKYVSLSFIISVFLKGSPLEDNIFA